jgi:acetylornithine/N-succinyldiaminopimelate aminotransferase
MSSSRQDFLRYLGQTSPEPLLTEIVRAEGIYLYGTNGERYIDLISGVSVSNTGHANKNVVEAVQLQAADYMHLMVYGEYIQSPQTNYAKKLVSLLPQQLESVYFVNSGSEAVEGALKLARRFTGRPGIVTFENAYHGSTFGALSVQGSDIYSHSFRPLLPGVTRARFNDPGAADLITSNTACVIVEPVQAEAGVIIPENNFLSTLRQRCDDTGTLLIFDECQTAFGRTGTMFCFERYQVVPDILVLAKALGGGMPLGAFISSRKILHSLSNDPPLGHITTFGGHPVCCAAGLASLNVIIDNDLSNHAGTMGSLFKERLKHPLIAGIKGDGLLLAVKLKKPELVKYLVTNAPRFGLLTDFFLFCNDSFRIAPPLTITASEVEEACSGLIRLLDEAESVL